MTGNSMGNKKTRGIWNVFFSRTTIIVLLILLQLALMFFMHMYLKHKALPLYTLLSLVGFLVVVYIMNTDQKPEFKLAWIIPVILFPVFGGLLYLYTRLESTRKVLKRELNETRLQTAPYLKQNPYVLEDLQKAEQLNANLAFYLLRQQGYPVYKNTEVNYLESGEAFYEELVEQLKSARRFIFLEFFIVSDGYVWDSIYKILKYKADNGVDIRFMCDGTNVISNVPYRFPKNLAKDGIKCKFFSPLRPIISTYQNNRDHRKICVIDGNIGFTGGSNLADEYINRRERFGHWKDAAVMLKGDGVRNLTLMFLQMWNVGEKDPDNLKQFLVPRSRVDIPGTGYVIPFGDNPLDREYVGERVYFHILEHARKYVHIMTPYLVLDGDMLEHLKYAAKSGIEVMIIMPHIPDKKYAFALAKTYYEELLEAGVEIYEYTPGFVHAKVYVSDDDTAVVGTINCDFRSLFLHFECGAYMYRNVAVQDAEADFQNTLRRCQKISIVDCRQRSAISKAMGKILRLFAPLF